MLYPAGPLLTPLLFSALSAPFICVLVHIATKCAAMLLASKATYRQERINRAFNTGAKEADSTQYHQVRVAQDAEEHHYRVDRL